jgi:hypothetical protein
MRKILVGIPVIYCDECVKLCLESLSSQAADLIIVDNDSTPEIKKMIKDLPTIVNPKNVYVNPAWNQLMKYFLETDHDYLIILNSDMILENGAIDKIRNIDIDSEKTIVLPNVSDHHISEGILTIDWGFPGIMIVLTRKMVEIVYPIPNTLKLWFGDDWVFKRLKKNGYQLQIHYGIKAKHSGSRSISSLKEAESLIECDKVNWQTEEKNL